MLILVRHGRTAANAAGVLLGRLDPLLDDVGVDQAERLATWLGKAERVISSPLLRARATAERLAGADAAVEIDDRWIEVDYGEFDGRPIGGVASDVWERWRSDPTFAPAGGESLEQVANRVAGACEELLAQAADADVVVVSHVSPIKAALGWALGCGPEVAWRSHLDPASITRITASPRGPVLRSFNEVGHLR